MKFSLKRTKSTASDNRLDGYNAYRASVVTTFQGIIEREIASLPPSEQVTAYDGLRLALLKARSTDMHFIGYESDDLMHLRAIYNQVTYAGNEIAYCNR